MSRKDYQALAASLASNRPLEGQPQAVEQWQTDCQRIADALASDNPRLDRSRFLEACER
jgi:hypothetical protein